MSTPEETLRALRDGAISLDEAERRLTVPQHPEAQTAPRAALPASPVPSADSRSARVDDGRDRRVAIVGMSGRYAGAPDLARYWENLARSTCSIREIPTSRWDVRPYFRALPVEKGKIYCKWMGMMDEVEYFDPLFFNISPNEAEMMDPQQRVFLQEAYRALEDAGYSARALSAKRCGVYLGIMGNEYLAMLHQRRPGAADTTGNSFAIAAARLSYFLNLKGPAIAVDTACSSSLVATHLAYQALLGGDVDMAVVGGVTLYLSPSSYLGMCSAGMLSPDGRCRPFDNGANGFVPGEGAGALVLKRLLDAEADGDAIYGLIGGSAINQDGRTNGITAPSMQSQMAVAREVYERSRVDPGDVDYVEMHGTGTKLGDPVELEALSSTFKERTGRRRYCGIGSVKSNIGHASAAAGMASVQKVLLSLQHGQIPPTLHVEHPNEHFDFEDSPFYLNTALKAWPPSPRRARRAAVSSFGFSGTNAHMLIEEYRPSRAAEARSRRASVSAPLLFVLSAKSEERLAVVAGRLLAWLEAAEGVDLADLAFTLQVGREPLDHRLTFIADDRDTVLQVLRAAAEGRPHPSVLAGYAKKGRAEAFLLEDDEDVEALVNAWLEKRKLPKLAKAWLGGLEVDWARLYGEPRPQRLHLPGYPFARERCWIPEGPADALPDGRTALSGALHPLLHHNVSDLFELRYTSTFTGREPFLEDHLVEGSRVMPGAALLEMARAAIAFASHADDAMCLEDVTWSKPLVVDRERARVDIRLAPEEAEQIAFEITSPSSNGASPIVHSRGRRSAAPLGPAPTLALDAIRARCARRSVSKAQCYDGFEAVGLHYGPSHQRIEEIAVGDGEALAALSSPARDGDGGDGFVLDPGVVDASLQSAAGLLTEEERGGSLALPVAVERVEIFGRSSGAAWAHVKRRPASDERERRFDVDVCDAKGSVSCRIVGFLVRVLTSAKAVSHPRARVERDAGEINGRVMLLPVWDAVQPASAEAPSSGHLIVVGSPDACARVTSAIPTARGVDASSSTTIEETAARLEGIGPIERIVWVGSATRSDDLTGVLAKQTDGVLCLFRVVKALLRLGYSDKPLEWTMVTVASQRVSPADVVDPTHAGVHGLFGSLAKEQPRWRVRLLDLEAEHDLTAEILSVPPDARGRSLIRRGGEWLRRKLVPVELEARERGGFRSKGVYVIVGGAGGLGEVWTEYMIRTYQANVVWIGRRAIDVALQEKIDRLGALGASPVYLQADARDEAALGEAYQAIKQQFARVHGVVVSTIDLQDKSLAKMDEATFMAGLTAKVDVAVRVAHVFRNDTLDFLLFFSSVQSFQNAAGQANYAAGCAFSDALAGRLAVEWPCPVKVMNWGYWGGHGVVASETYQERMAGAGIGSISPQEGMEALEGLMSSPLDQIAFLKTTRAVRLEEVDAAEVVEESRKESPRVLASLPQGTRGADERRIAALAARHRAEMDGLLATLVGAQLVASGLDEDALRAGAARGRRERELYGRWLDETAALLGLTSSGGRRLPRGAEIDAAWREWEIRSAEWAADPDRRAQVRLLDATLRSLPDVLMGRRAATDVMFPASSFELVEGIYHGNAFADFYNQTAAEIVATAVAKKVEQLPSARIHILEIGAGTGGTTAAILEKLGAVASRIDEYCFTDLSTAFLTRAQEQWGGRLPYFTTKRFDVEAAPADQGLDEGAYDVIVAANVLHATRRIRDTLRNTKAALKRHGLLVAVEISQTTLFTHLTVGLLEGWWRHEDPTLRIAGCPGLSPQRWDDVLGQEGFSPVIFPVRAAHETGQQIIVAESDGLVRRRVSRAREDARPAPVRSAVSSVEDVEPRPEAPPRAPEGLDALVTAEIVRALSEALKVSADVLDPDDAFSNYGVDSISGVRLVQRLNDSLGISLTPTDLFDHGSVRRMTAYVVAQFGASIGARGAAAEVAPSTSPPAAGPSSHQVLPPLPPSTCASPPRAPMRRAPRDPMGAPSSKSGRASDRAPIAVIGMSGRFARSEDLDALWRHLAHGDDLVKDVTRWDLSRLHPEGSRFCRRGSFVDGIDLFDPLFFKIAATEANYMDPQQRLFLEEAWKALEDAGYAGVGVGGRACGVYVGCSGSDYQMLFGGEVPAQAFWGNADSIVPARIAYHLDLQGPAIAVDTACSSSLVAVHLACQGLWSGETEMALAGGVYLNTTPWFFQSAERAGMLSHGGHCHVFDERADGFVPGEGVGVVVLKRLDAALADGDFVHGVLRGSGINQDGTTNGITAPSARSQERLERHVYETFGVDPAEIQLVEAHGTGTKLGDPIEVDALTRAFRAFTDRREYCALGSVKSNLGHATAAAGIAGLLKVLLALKHREIPPSLHFRRVNPNIRLEGSPFFVSTSLRPWEIDADRVRRAAVSSFGFSGTNAHVVVEEAPPATSRPASTTHALVTLSARTGEQLRQQAERLAEHFERHETRHEATRLADVSWTLLTGRKHLDHRLACVAADRGELARELRRWLASDGSTRVVAGEASQQPSERALWNERGARRLLRYRGADRPSEHLEHLTGLGECFVRGATIDAKGLFEGERCGRVPLPTYPFARERYWVPTGSATSARETIRETAGMEGRLYRLHPLVGRNVSTLDEERFVTRLTWDDVFVGQHRVRGKAVLPGVAFLELARAAGALAAERQVVKLGDVAWLRPVVVPEEGLEVAITLEPEADGSMASFAVTSAEDVRAVHARGTMSFASDDATAPRPPKLDIAAIEARCARHISGAECYAALEARGLRLGPALQAVRALRTGAAEVLASLHVPGEHSGELLLHPAVMDGSLQAAVGLEMDAEPMLYLPFTLAEVEVWGPVASVGFAHITVSGEGESRTADVYISDEDGNVLVTMKGFVARPMRAAAPAAPPRVVRDVAESGTNACATLCFERVWEDAPMMGGGDAPIHGTAAVTTIVFDRDRQLFERMSSAAPSGSSARVLLAARGARWEALGGGVFTVRSEVEADVDRLFEEIDDKPHTLRLVHVVSNAREVSATNGERRGALLRQTEEIVLGLLHAVRAARRRFPDAALELISLTSTDGETAPHVAAVGAFLRAAAAESPRVSWKTVELPEGNDDATLGRAIHEIGAGTHGAVEVSYQEGRRRQARWRETERGEAPSGFGALREGGVYLISGGLGALGGAVALHFARRARARLVLCGRSPLDDAGGERLRELERLGAAALYVQADVSRPEEVERLVAQARARFGAVHGVVHAAGTIRDSLIMRKTREEVEAVLAPKVLGASFLDEATRDDPLDFFVCFSSLAAAIGNAGQSDYAYANAFMDAHARRRANLVRRGERRGRSVSIGWPLWRLGGLRIDDAHLEVMRAASGMRPLDTAEGLAVLDEVLASSREGGHVLVVSGEERRLREWMGREASRRTPSSGARLSEDSARDLERELLGLAASVVGLGEEALRVEKSLVDYGFDSLSFATLAERVAATLGVALSPAVFFEFPTVRALAAHLLEERGDALAARSSNAPATSPPPEPSSPPPHGRLTGGRVRAPRDLGAREAARAPEPVAIVGLAAQMPRSTDLDAFWEHLERGRDLVTEVPRDRWERAGFAAALADAGEEGARLWGGFLDDVDAFDAPFFEISRREAELMDPQQRIFLELVWRTVEDAGYRMSDLGGTRTGVFVGASTADYGDVVRASRARIEGHMATGLAPSVLANRVSYLFDLRGPSEPVDTACSSALVAIHRAVEAIGHGRCDQAIAGGINVLLTPSVFISFLKAGMLSPDGRCKTFDKRANGYVRGEGGGAVLLKPLRRALEDGDHVYAVIRGTAVNHGGRASSLTAPNMTAQAEVLVEAYERAGVDPSTVNYIEAHGTGTALGDPIEIDGLKRAFRELFARRGERPTVGSCGLGSVKTNIGHLEAAAGIAGLVKVLLALKHRVLPPAVHFSELNPYVRLDGSPFYVVERPTPWVPARRADGAQNPRRAGISSFGFGGANAHLVLEEHRVDERAPAARSRPALVVLSAKTEQGLRAAAANLRQYVERCEATEALDLTALAFTLQVGREAFEHRLAIVVESVATLRAQLEAFETRRGAGSVVGRPEALNGAGERLRADALHAFVGGDLETAASLWVRGAEIDWRAGQEERPRRLALPTYPFARERYWLEPAERASKATSTVRSTDAVDDDGPPWRARLETPGADRRGIIESFLCLQIARMLKLDAPDGLDPRRPLVGMGFDSLMALQLKKTVEAHLALDVSLIKLLGGESTADLADRLFALLSGGSATTPEVRLSDVSHRDDDVLEGVL